jgi:hypothetical protein
MLTQTRRVVSSSGAAASKQGPPKLSWVATSATTFVCRTSKGTEKYHSLPLLEEKLVLSKELSGRSSSVAESGYAQATCENNLKFASEHTVESLERTRAFLVSFEASWTRRVPSSALCVRARARACVPAPSSRSLALTFLAPHAPPDPPLPINCLQLDGGGTPAPPPCWRGAARCLGALAPTPPLVDKDELLLTASRSFFLFIYNNIGIMCFFFTEKQAFPSQPPKKQIAQKKHPPLGRAATRTRTQALTHTTTYCLGPAVEAHALPGIHLLQLFPSLLPLRGLCGGHGHELRLLRLLRGQRRAGAGAHHAAGAPHGWGGGKSGSGSGGPCARAPPPRCCCCCCCCQGGCHQPPPRALGRGREEAHGHAQGAGAPAAVCAGVVTGAAALRARPRGASGRGGGGHGGHHQRPRGGSGRRGGGGGGGSGARGAAAHGERGLAPPPPTRR